MEDNKPFMPPPPPKMPPFPPRDQAQGQVTKQEVVQQQPEALNQTTGVENVSKPENPVVYDNVLQSETVVPEKVAPVAKKEPMSKEKKKNTLITALYWGGFAICLVGIALCIFFIVK